MFSPSIPQWGDVKSILFVTPILIYDFREEIQFPIIFFTKLKCHISPELY